MDRFNKFYGLLAQHLPRFKIAFKTESSFMKFINIFLHIFNKNFMTSFITTIGYTVYFPNPNSITHTSMVELAHEYVHATDAKRMNPVLYSFLYLLPLSLFPFIFALGFVWWPLFLISLIFFMPLPAIYRTKSEFHGYVMTLFVINEIYKERDISTNTRKMELYKAANTINKHFTGWDYYLMWPFGKKAKLQEKVDKIISGDILKEDAIYEQVQMAFIESKA